MKRTMTALVALLAVALVVTACATPTQANSTTASTRTPSWPTLTPVPSTPTPRMVQTKWVLTHSNYGRPSAGSIGGAHSMRCPMPEDRTLLTIEKPEIKFDSGTVLVEIKEGAYWVRNWAIENSKDGNIAQNQTSPEKAGTVYVQPADCTVTIKPANYSLKVD